MKTVDRILLILSALGMVTLMYLIFMVVPADRAQGLVQKVFYVHVPAAWVAFAWPRRVRRSASTTSRWC